MEFVTLLLWIVNKIRRIHDDNIKMKTKIYSFCAVSTKCKINAKLKFSKIYVSNMCNCSTRTICLVNDINRLISNIWKG